MRTVKPSRTSKVTDLFKERTPERDPILVAMDEAREAGQQLWGKERGYFKPSGAGDECSRSLTFESAGHNVPWPARTLRIFKMGNAIEDGVANDLSGAELLLSRGEKISSKQPSFWGFMDVEVRDPVTGETLLGEVKSINERRFKGLPPAARWNAKDGPAVNAAALVERHRGYLCQWNVYARARGHTKGFLFFENKNTSEQRLFRLERDDALLAEVDAVHRQAEFFAKLSNIAPVPDDRRPQAGNDSVCKDCRHGYLCRALPTGTVEFAQAREKDKELR